jgi:ribosome biogenesis GTPase
VSSKARLGWGPFFAEQVDDANRGLLFARVIQEHRALLRVAGDSDGWAAVSGRFRHEAGSAADFPVVGDWVTLTVTDHSRAVIQSCLKRRSVVARAAAGRATSRQVIAANVDTVFVVTTATEDLSERRLDRYLTMVWDSGAMPVVIVNKADLMTSGEDIVGWLRARLPFVDVVALSALTDTTLAPLVPYLQPGVTIALVGSSGVGKSTLVNRLLGRDLQRVGAVRESDQT